VTGEIITVDDEQLATMRKASDFVPRADLEELTNRNCMHSACDVRASQPSQVQVNVNVQALRLEYKSGWLDFFRTGPRTRRLALDSFTVEIAGESASSDLPTLIEKIKSSLDIAPSLRVDSEVSDTSGAGRCAPSTYVAVRDDDRSPDACRTGAPALDVWA